MVNGYARLIDVALRIAHDDVAHDLRERGRNNAGRDIEWIRSQDGTGKRTDTRGAWCAAYVSSVWHRAAGHTRVLLPFATSRGARALYRNVGRAGSFRDDPTPGAVVCWRRGTGWTGHVELVASVELTPAGLQFWTYGGNRGPYPAAVCCHGPYLLRAERESGLLGFAALL